MSHLTVTILARSRCWITLLAMAALVFSVPILVAVIITNEWPGTTGEAEPHCTVVLTLQQLTVSTYSSSPKTVGLKLRI